MLTGMTLLLATAVMQSSEGSAAATGARLDALADHRFPVCSAVLNVKKAPYYAVGDGVHDDTAAIQRALNDLMGTHRILFFPNGTYLISKTLNWANKNSNGGNAWGFNWLQGQNPLKTIIKLKDGVFTDPKSPTPLMWCGGFGSADWFHNYVEDFTFDTGKGNPGAVGLQFYSNNVGAVRNLLIASGDGAGKAGLDLGHRNMNGPLLAKNIEVRGFETGIHTGNAVNSQTFENITLSGQKEFGFDNHGQSVAIHNVRSENSVPAIRTYGVLSLLTADLRGVSGAKDFPAIVNYNGGRIGLRDIVTTGYKRAIGDVTTPDYWTALRISGPDKPGSLGPKVDEYYSQPGTSPFSGRVASLRLPIEETPEIDWEDPSKWAVVDTFGADPTGSKDSSAAIQRAIDSGATTIFFPGAYALDRPVTVRGKVRRLLGCGNWLDYQNRAKPSLIISSGASKAVVVEHFFGTSGIEIRTDRDVVLRSIASEVKRFGPGKLFLEDITTGDLRNGTGQKLWARQLNVENEGTHFTNDGSTAWILGYKTERGGTLALTKNGAKTEIFGTMSYTTTAGKLAPMFVTDNASIFAYFAEICFNGDPFLTLIQETRGFATKTVKRADLKAGDAGISPYVGRGGTN